MWAYLDYLALLEEKGLNENKEEFSIHDDKLPIDRQVLFVSGV